MFEKISSKAIRREVAEAKFGDARLSGRLERLTEALAENPSASLPKATKGSAALEASYRFLNNRRVTPEQILKPHIEHTMDRMRSNSSSLVIHDTTQLVFPGDEEREGLGPIKGGKACGFYAHVGLALKDAESRTPLGVVGLHTWVREKRKKAKKVLQRRSLETMGRESDRWREAIDVFEREFATSRHAVHVMDREGDMYALLAWLVEENHRFVIRTSHDRVIKDADHARLLDKIDNAPSCVVRNVPLSRRRRSRLPGTRRSTPPRNERRAALKVGACPVTLCRPYQYRVGERAPELTLNVVWVREENPPADQPAVSWTLFTTEPIDTIDDMLAIVDSYRARWTIEEFFKALKTGCGIQRRQLASYDALTCALAVSLPIAWKLLALRHAARESPDASASFVLTDIQLRLLRFLMRTQKNATLPDNPTQEDVLLGIATLGGHIKYNGPPGWLILSRGYDDLWKAELGYQAMMAPEM